MCSYVLQPGDTIEAVNLQKNIEEIQRELQTALSIHMGVAKTKDFIAPDPQIAMELKRVFQPAKCYSGQEFQK